MLCVGLDTDFAKIPECVKAGRTVGEAVLEFNKRIIDATAPHCIAFKPNLAFYECLGVDGMAILDKTVDYIRSNHSEQFIIADAKRGDIGNTARMYAKSLFETFDFDTVGDEANGIAADHCVTIRERDSMEQVRIPIDQVRDFLREKCAF